MCLLMFCSLLIFRRKLRLPLRPGQILQGIPPYVSYTIKFDLTGNSPSSENKPFNYDIFEQYPLQPDYSCELIDGIPTFFTPVDISGYLKLFTTIYTNAVNPKISSPLIIKSSILSLLGKCYEETNLQHFYPDVILRSIKFINENLDKNLSIELIAKQLNLRTKYFQHIFKKHLKVTPNTFITNARLEKAKEMLATSDLNVCEIAYICGFSDPTYFNYVFKKNLKHSPGQFRNKFRNLH